MQVLLAERFARSYVGAPPEVQKAFGKQLANLLRDLRHRSLDAKKYERSGGVWQARVNGGWQFYFRIEGDVYVLLDIMSHPK